VSLKKKKGREFFEVNGARCKHRQTRLEGQKKTKAKKDLSFKAKDKEKALAS
jgi:hypothetical protein